MVTRSASAPGSIRPASGQPMLVAPPAVATAGGATSIGWPEAGRIEPGALADLVTIGLGSVQMAGTSADHALESVVFSASATDVHDVMVGGHFVVREGTHLGIDVAAELAEAIAGLPG